MSQKNERSSSQALHELYPRRSLWVCAALVASVGLLLLALSQPILYTQQMIFWKQTYTVWTGILDLWRLDEYLLAILVFLFSMVFPFAKLLIMTYVWFVRLPKQRRMKLLRWLGVFGKWSMLDVFVVAILVVLIKVGSLARIEARFGVYLFGAAIIVSMLTTAYVDRCAKASMTDEPKLS